MKGPPKLGQLLAALLLLQNVASIVPINNTDFTTDFAKQVIRISKAADIKAYMNEQIDPCDDFYKFSCGNWHRINPAQLLTNIITDTFQTLQKAYDRKLRHVITASRNENELQNKVKDFHEACLTAQQSTGREKHYKEVRDMYREFGEMPAVSGGEWNETEFVWWKSIARIQHKYGRHIIVNVQIMDDIEDTSVKRIYLEMPDDAGKVSSKLINVLQLTKTVRQLRQVLGLESAEARSLAKELIAFESQLTHGATSSGGGRLEMSLKDLITNYTLEELQVMTGDALNIREYLETVLGGYVPSQIYIFDEQYWHHMLVTVAKTPKRVVANYVLWQLMQEFIVQSDGNMDWCLDRTKKYFGKYIDNLVYSQYKSEKVESDIYGVWQELKQTFRENLQGDKLDWIHNDTRMVAIEKLDAMQMEINSYDSENFTEQYNGVQINRQSFVANMKQLLQRDMRQQLAKMNETRATFEDTEVASYTPIYNILTNKIQMPVMLLQPLYFWDERYPQAIKYATLGYLIAHEMIHGFDDDGRRHDKDGNVKEWWDAKSTYEFESRRKCFQAQYHSYKYAGNQLAESITQSENIADNAGVKLAYAAYMKWWNRQEDDDVMAKEQLPGLAYTNRQLFFISFAQIWCDDVQFLFKSSVSAGDEHAPSMYRVIGTLSNFQEFSWVFKCKPDAPMDPEFKCAVY